MRKLKINLLLIISIFGCWNYVQAEVITLKSGKVLNAEILERTKEYVKVKYSGLEIYYENKCIKSIEPQVLVSLGEKIPQKPDLDKQASFKKGIEQASAGNFEEARRIFQKQLSDLKGALGILNDLDNGLMSKEYAAYLFQGSGQILNEEYGLAVLSLEKAWEINPNDPDLNYNLGYAYFSLGEYEKSIIYLYALLKLQPSDAGAYELIAKDYCSLGEYQKAEDNLLIARDLLRKNGDEDGLARIEELLEIIAATAP